MKRLASLLFLSALAASLLTGCDMLPTCDKPAQAPTATCSTPATIVYPVCNVLHCPDHPTLLRLADNTTLNPRGTDWDNFQVAPSNTLPTRVLINYTPEVTPAVYPWFYATITCISAVAE